jgi:hypothetical protein
MASSWSGKLVVIAGVDGKHHVGITLPTRSIPGNRFQVYDATGPYPPTGFPDTVAIDDLTSWLDQKRREGFTFTLSTI